MMNNEKGSLTMTKQSRKVMKKDEAEAALETMCEQARVPYEGERLRMMTDWAFTQVLSTSSPSSSSFSYKHTEGDLKACLSVINKEVEFSKFAVRGINIDGKEHIGFINTVSIL